MKYAHIFGPVQSRRLGRSLGVDMVPFKTCNCNCVYCECGAAAPIAHERKEYIVAGEIRTELDDYLGTAPQIDYVTFAGSGEPTLNSGLGTIVQFVKKRYPAYKTALLTNGFLLHLAEVREEILDIDLVLPSLDAVSEDCLKKINRPFPGVTARQMINGIAEFSKVYSGQMWIEVFIVPGVNDTPDELARFKDALTRINPNRVQLNSLDRPGACTWVVAAEISRLEEIASFLQPLPVEIVSRNGTSSKTSLPGSDAIDATILHQIRRRPATIEEIAVFCGTTINRVERVLSEMVAAGHVEKGDVGGRVFFSVS